MRKDTQWIPIGKAAKYLGVSRDTLRRWEKKGKIKAVRSPTNRRYYTKKQLDGIKSGKMKPKTDKLEIKIAITPKQKLILIGALSFILAVILALLFFWQIYA